MTTGEVIALIKALSGGGGSGGDGNFLIVNATFAYDDVGEEWSVTLDKTFAEISAASNAGKIVLCIPYESENGATGYPCVMTVESIEAFANTDIVDLGDANSTVLSFNFGINNNDGTYAEATTWSKGGGVLVVTDTDGTLDKTWQEIHDAMLSGGAVIQYGEAPAPNGVKVISDCMELPGLGYTLIAGNAGDGYNASSASDYPTLSE